MFEKKKIAFNMKEIFGVRFKADNDYAYNVMTKILFNNKAEMNGKIEASQILKFTKAELWAYIYYLYYYNNNKIEEFKQMQLKGKASAELFYNVVGSNTVHNIKITANTKRGEFPPYTPNTLVEFINLIIDKYGNALSNPIFDYFQILMTEKKSQLKGVVLNIGNTDLFEITTDPKKIKEEGIIKVEFKRNS